MPMVCNSSRFGSMPETRRPEGIWSIREVHQRCQDRFISDMAHVDSSHGFQLQGHVDFPMTHRNARVMRGNHVGNCPIVTIPPREDIQNRTRSPATHARAPEPNRHAPLRREKDGRIGLRSILQGIPKIRSYCGAVWQSPNKVILLDLHFETPKGGFETGTFLNLRLRTEKPSRHTLRHSPDRRNIPNEIIEKMRQRSSKEIHRSSQRAPNKAPHPHKDEAEGPSPTHTKKLLKPGTRTKIQQVRAIVNQNNSTLDRSTRRPSFDARRTELFDYVNSIDFNYCNWAGMANRLHDTAVELI